jgi:hypothetical protein
MPPLPKKQSKRIAISLSEMLSDDEKRVIAARRFMWNKWIEDVVSGKAA